MCFTNPTVPLPYCALRYLLMWLQHERRLHAAFVRQPSADEFRLALKYFRISRNFIGIGSDQRLGDVRTIYLSVVAKTGIAPEERVILLAERFQEEFGNFNISASSKLLWLTKRAPFVVLDARAVKGLKAVTGESFPSNDYQAYVAAWRRYYRKVRDEISFAASLLPEAATFLPANRPSDTQLRAICRSAWFRERVLDIFLWETGDDG